MKKLVICGLLAICGNLFSAIDLSSISFVQAMQPNANFNAEKSLENPEWKLVKLLYEKYVIDNTYYTQKVRIPKIIHHIWLGSPIPEQYQQFRETWMRLHPDWEFMLWTDGDVEAFGLQNKKLYDSVANYGAKSDIARYEILYRFGGLYVDTDFECLHTFDELHHRFNFYTGLGFEANVLLYNGLMASVPGHPILKHCIESLSANVPDPCNAEMIMKTTGPSHFNRSFFQIVPYLHDDPIVVFPTAYFYPWPHFLRKDPDPRKWIRKESFTLHYWEVSWLKN